MSIFPPQRKLECSRCNKPLGDRHWKSAYCKKCQAQYARDYRKLNPLNQDEVIKQKVRWTSSYYQKKGVLKKQPCYVCGAEKTEKHHEDYSKPLDIVWLCRPCHRKLHASRKVKPVDK